MRADAVQAVSIQAWRAIHIIFAYVLMQRMSAICRCALVLNRKLSYSYAHEVPLNLWQKQPDVTGTDACETLIGRSKVRRATNA
jgi:hypothetical protein